MLAALASAGCFETERGENPAWQIAVGTGPDTRLELATLADLDGAVAVVIPQGLGGLYASGDLRGFPSDGTLRVELRGEPSVGFRLTVSGAGDASLWTDCPRSEDDAPGQLTAGRATMSVRWEGGTCHATLSPGGETLWTLRIAAGQNIDWRFYLNASVLADDAQPR